MSILLVRGSIVTEPSNKIDEQSSYAPLPEEASRSHNKSSFSATTEDSFIRRHLPLHKFNHTRAALIIEISILMFAGFISWSFWNIWCPNGVEQCLGTTNLAPAHYLGLSFVRPLLLTPHAFGTYVAARTFNEELAILLAAVGSTLSTIPVYGIMYIIGKTMVIPWMSRNLPSTLRFIRSQDSKLIFAARLIPVFPFDIVSFFAGAFNLKPFRVLLFTFIGILPECIFLVYMSSPNVTLLGWTVNAIGLTAGLILAPLILFEWHSRKQGLSMLSMLSAAYKEIMAEASLNNQIVRRNKVIDPNKTPILLVYGFFSSQRSLNILERQLVLAGFDVFSFNLGGLFGTFFTQGIMESANFIDYKIKRQMERHGFKKIHIVAHSKGSLVSLWWLLKLGGSKYCDKLVAMAPPCSGSPYTYLALITPLAFFWRDIWQMRPGSSFLKYLRDSDVPENLKIHIFYSERDSVSRGRLGVFVPKSGHENISSKAMNDLTHFDFVIRRESIREVIKILSDSTDHAPRLVSSENLPLARLGGDDGA
jgi:uncharacterized membrane protein YdjX (TVP38/TMEM64 family)/pimeloyl-ACP methyl ester carboxylesterase